MLGRATFISGGYGFGIVDPPLTRLLDSLPSFLPSPSHPSIPLFGYCPAAAPTRSSHPFPFHPDLPRRHPPLLFRSRRGAEIHLCAARVDLVIRCWRRPWPPSSSTGGPPSACASPRRSTRWSPAAPSARSSPFRSLSSLTSL